MTALRSRYTPQKKGWQELLAWLSAPALAAAAAEATFTADAL